MSSFVLVGIGGSIGAIGRYLVSLWWKSTGNSFPWGTLLVNLMGSFWLGWMVQHISEPQWMLLLGVGFLGSFTTFSTLQWECFQMIKNRQWRMLFGYIGVTYIGGGLLGWIGYYSS